MITRRYREPRVLDDDTPFYWFYVAALGAAPERIKITKPISSGNLKVVSSNLVLSTCFLDRLLGKRVMYHNNNAAIYYCG
jgi:hypothetical protein